MPTPRKRRPYGTRDAVPIFVEVDPASKAVFEDLVRSTGTSKWAVFEALMEHTKTQLDDAGCPVWWPAGDEASTAPEELPLARRA